MLVNTFRFSSPAPLRRLQAKTKAKSAEDDGDDGDIGEIDHVLEEREERAHDDSDNHHAVEGRDNASRETQLGVGEPTTSGKESSSASSGRNRFSNSDRRKGRPAEPSESSEPVAEPTASAAEAAVESSIEERTVAPAPKASPAPNQQRSRRTLFACDICPHVVFPSHDEFISHVLERHPEGLGDYRKMLLFVAKLDSRWQEVVVQRKDKIKTWGEKTFGIASQRDGGERKMVEAHRAREQLEVVVQRWHPTCNVFMFGSTVATGVWDGIADIDFTAVDINELNSGVWPPIEKNAVRSITELLRRAGFSFFNLEPVSHARVPIIKHHASLPIAVGARKEAEDIIARSVRFHCSAQTGMEDRLMLEGSVREAVGPDAVQQVWWNRSGDMMSMTFATTTDAVRAASCSPGFVTPSMRVRMQPVHDEHRPELHGVDFDLSFRAFGVRNSELLRRYLQSHPCARPGSIVLKDWSKTSGVNNSLNGYFTSYAISIMWIYYLVQKKHIAYVDPLDVPGSLAGAYSLNPPYVPMVDPALSSKDLEEMHLQMGEMIVEFFHYYSCEFDWQHNVVSLNRPEVTTKEMLGWDCADVSSMKKRGVKRYEMCIEDPYEENLNLGRHLGPSKAVKVRQELMRALISLLKDSEMECCVFSLTNQTAAEKPAVPTEALMKLAAITVNAIELSKRKQALNDGDDESPKATAGQSSANRSIGGGEGGGGGVSEESLRREFNQRAPLAFALASKAWNWQQLIHRLGYKLHRGHVLPRRDFGVRRLPDKPGSSSNEASKTQITHAPPSLNERMIEDLSNDYMTLTPEWVAWSRPWVSHHVRGFRQFSSVKASPDSSSTTTATAIPTATPTRMFHSTHFTGRQFFSTYTRANISFGAAATPLSQPVFQNKNIWSMIVRRCRFPKR